MLAGVEHIKRLLYMHSIGRHDRRPAFGCPRCIEIRGPLLRPRPKLENIKRLAYEVREAILGLEPTPKTRELAAAADRLLAEFK